MDDVYEVVAEQTWGDFQRVALLSGPPGLNLKALLAAYLKLGGERMATAFVDWLVEWCGFERLKVSGILLDPETLEVDPYGS